MSNLTGQPPYKKGQKRPKSLSDMQREDIEFREWERTLPCCICASPPPNEAAHVRFNEEETDGPGMAYKPLLKSIPLCSKCHNLQHQKSHTIYGNKAFWLSLAKHYLTMFRAKRKMENEGTN